MKHVKLSRDNHRNKNIICIQFPYDVELIEIAKEIGSGRKMYGM